MTRPLASLLLLSMSVLQAQSASDPTGHWEGTIAAAGFEQRIEIDFARGRGGEVIGTITIPAERIERLPLTVAVEGSSIRFHARADQPITAVLSPDGLSMAASYSVGGYSVPFALIRTGEARSAPAASNRAVGPGFVGVWNGTLRAKGEDVRLVLTLVNDGDGTSRGSVVLVDQGQLQIPATVIRQEDASLTIEFASIGASYEATLNPEGTELAGNVSQGADLTPATFRRSTATDVR